MIPVGSWGGAVGGNGLLEFNNKHSIASCKVHELWVITLYVSAMCY